MSTPKTQPFLSPGRQTWNAPVTNWQGKRSNKSLGTKDVSEARAICRELNDLAKSQLLPDDTALSLVSPIAYKLYYDREKFIRLSGDAAPITSPLNRDEANEMLAELVALRKRVKEFEGLQEKYDALLQTLEGKRLEASRKSPTMDQVEAEYLADLAKLARGGGFHKTIFPALMVKFRDYKIADITPAELNSFLDADEALHDDPGRRTRVRVHISRFFSWAELTHGISSPMNQVSAGRKTAIPDIDWHSLEDVEAVIEKLPPYWAAVVGCMAYAGLSAHEVRGLRPGDLYTNKDRRFLRVTPTDKRGLKTAARKRSVAVSARLDKLLKAYEPGEDFIFPALTETGGLWYPDYFTKCLGTWLPKGMNALSLRRTFGSLMIHSGKREEEVAAAMGNSAAMVRRHYGRILGDEVDSDF